MLLASTVVLDLTQCLTGPSGAPMLDDVGGAVKVKGEPTLRANPPAHGEHTEEIPHSYFGWDADRVAAAAADGGIDVEETK